LVRGEDESRFGPVVLSDLFYLDFQAKLDEEKQGLVGQSARKQNELEASLSQKNADYENLEAIYRNDIEKLETTLIRINLDNQSLNNEYNNFNKLLKLKESEISQLRGQAFEASEQFKSTLDAERQQHQHLLQKQAAEFEGLQRVAADAAKENQQLKANLAVLEDKCCTRVESLVDLQQHYQLVEKSKFLQEKLELLQEKCSLMQNDNLIKKQENEDLAKLLDSESLKITMLVKQLEDLQQFNTHLNVELNESKEQASTLEAVTGFLYRARSLINKTLNGSPESRQDTSIDFLVFYPG
jgi:hypothetical protein